MITILKHFASSTSTFGTAMFIAALFDQKGIDWFFLGLGAYMLAISVVFIIFAACMEEQSCN